MIEHFTDLKAYALSRQLSAEIYRVSQTWPPEERYALTDQIRRCSRSVGANLAEAWAKRRYETHFISKLTDADGENHETEHWLSVAHSMDLLDSPTYEGLLERKLEIGRLLGSMIANPTPFLLRR